LGPKSTKKPASPSHFCCQLNLSLLPLFPHSMWATPMPPANVIVNHRHRQYHHEVPPDQFSPALLFFLLHLLPRLFYCSAKWIVELSTIHWTVQFRLNQNEWVGFSPIQKHIWAETDPTLLWADGGPTPLGWPRPKPYLWAELSPIFFELISAKPGWARPIYLG